jgi:hypothetical protein
MISKRSWLVVAIPLSLGAIVLIGADQSHKARSSAVIDPTCTSSSPCIQYNNNGAGPGVEGLSLGGNGLFGITKINSTSTLNGRAGVFGIDKSTSGAFNTGVLGTSTLGNGVTGSTVAGTAWLALRQVGATGCSSPRQTLVSSPSPAAMQSTRGRPTIAKNLDLGVQASSATTTQQMVAT